MQDSSNYRRNDSSRRVQSANPRGGNYNRSARSNIVEEWFGKHTFSKDWIEKEVDAAMVTYAENAGMFMAKTVLRIQRFGVSMEKLNVYKWGNMKMKKLHSFFCVLKLRMRLVEIVITTDWLFLNAFSMKRQLM